MHKSIDLSFRARLCRVEKSSHLVYICSEFGAKILLFASLLRMTTAFAVFMLCVLFQADSLYCSLLGWRPQWTCVVYSSEMIKKIALATHFILQLGHLVKLPMPHLRDGKTGVRQLRTPVVFWERDYFFTLLSSRFSWASCLGVASRAIILTV